MVDVAAIVRVVLSCAFVCALAWGLGVWLRRVQPLSASTRRLRLLESLPVGSGRAMLVVACGDRRFLVGATARDLQLLAELTPEPEESESPGDVKDQKHSMVTPGATALLTFALTALPQLAHAQATVPAAKLTLGRDSVEALLMLTLIALAPFLLAVMTCFSRIVIVLSLLRMGLGTPQTPPNPVLVGMALFLTMFVMAPTLQEANESALQPYLTGNLTTEQVIEVGIKPFRRFMLNQTREKDIAVFLRIDRQPNPKSASEVPTRILVPAFILSEVRTGFEIGFLVALPFMVVDIVIASVLMGMGMLMVPPMLISLPFKLLLFVLSDGWHLLMRGLALSVR